VTRYLQRELGYYLGYAYLPEQVPVNGVIRIAVLEGRLDEVILNWPDKMPVDRAVVEAYLARLKPGEILRVRDVERIVFLVNDLRGLNARSRSRPAARRARLAGRHRPAEERVSAASRSIRSARAISGRVARATSRRRSRARGTRRRPGGQPALVVHARLEFVLGGYTLPVGRTAQGRRVRLYTRYKLDEDLLDVSLSGDATTVTAVQPVPVIRSRNLNLFGLVSLDNKHFTTSSSARPEEDRRTDLRCRVGRSRATTCSPVASTRSS
jgi:hemolysin activation/secretion protein